MKMTDYYEFCRRYELDPHTDEAQAQYAEARRQLEILQRIDARHEAREAIERAREGTGDVR